MNTNITRDIVLCCALGAMLSGCGKQHKAEQVVGDFISANIVSDDYVIDYTPLDSTDRIPTERIAAMKKAAESDPLFKRGLSFGPVPVNCNKYMYTKAKFICGNDTMTRTFYLDAALTHVIAFKEN